MSGPYPRKYQFTRWDVFAALLLVVVLAIYVAYGANMIFWKNATDYGWRAMYDSGPHVVDEVFGLGWQAGLRPGDTILLINGGPYDTFDELFFKVRNTEPGEVNVYTVLRQGSAVDIHITNRVLGTVAVAKRSGPLFIVGLLYLFIGLLVYFMVGRDEEYREERRRESWVFLFMTAVLGVSISCASPSDLMRPLWFFNVRQFIDIFLPAPIIHLALIFPKKRFSKDIRRWVWFAPYIVSLLIILIFRPFSRPYWAPPAGLDLVNNLYLLAAVALFFLLSVLNLIRREQSPRVRAQSLMVILGVFLGFLIPVLELQSRHLWGLFLFRDPAVSFSLLLSAFPLCVGVAIRKYDLFEIDMAVRKSVGYVLTSAAIIAAYALVVASVEMALPGTDLARSRVFNPLFAVLLVLTFNSFYARVQRLVDRRFFRVKLDYKEAVQTISLDLTTLRSFREVCIRLIHAVRDIMFVDSAGVIHLRSKSDECPAVFIHDKEVSTGDQGVEDDFQEICLEYDDPLLSLMREKKRPVTRYDLNEDPEYAEKREVYQHRMDSLRVTMAIPLVFREEVIGLLMIGRKKSGRFYVKDDIDLLNTLASQGAIALENADRAEKMKEAEVYRVNLARYLPPEVVERAMHGSGDADLSGRMKKVAILVSDIRGFTRMTRTLSPKHLVAILNEYRTQMNEIIFRYNGSVDKHVGDAIVSVFGGFSDLRDTSKEKREEANPTEEAASAALEMLSEVSRLNEIWEKEFKGFNMEVGVGIDHGEVFIGNVGSPERMEYTVIGDAVNTASKLSEIARPGQVVMLYASARTLGEKFDIIQYRPEEPKKEELGEKVVEIVKKEDSGGRTVYLA